MATFTSFAEEADKLPDLKSIEQLGWMSGLWRGQLRDSEVEEHWVEPKGRLISCHEASRLKTQRPDSIGCLGHADSLREIANQKAFTVNFQHSPKVGRIPVFEFWIIGEGRIAVTNTRTLHLDCIEC